MNSILQAGNINDFKKQCDEGNGDACATVASAYAGFAKGIVEKDMQKAIHYWKKGCDLQSGSACTTYAMVLKDEEETISTLKKACNLGNENGCLAYKQMIKMKTLQDDCFKHNDIRSCAKLGEEQFLSGDYLNGKNSLKELCELGDTTSCSNLKIINSLKNYKSLSFIEDLSKQCSEKKDKYACEKVGTFLIEINSLIRKNVVSEEKKKSTAIETMRNMLIGTLYIKEACKLGRKESCRTAAGLEKALENISKR